VFLYRSEEQGRFGFPPRVVYPVAGFAHAVASMREGAALSMDTTARSAQNLRGLAGGSGLPRVFHQTVG
jgi:hypothetical protein